MSKSAEAFRTISEVAELLNTPTHVLRFWESRFPQIKPVKRAGGRRYYRPDDVALLGGIKHMLRQEGMTIRGVQQLIKAEGPRHVMALGGYDESMPGEEEAAEELGALDAAPEAPAADLPDAGHAPEPWAAAPFAPESAPFPADPEDWPPEAAPEAWPADPADPLAQDAPEFAPEVAPEWPAAEWPAAEHEPEPEPDPQGAAAPVDV
ncbi:MAG: MerR family transcriptional regulator, partial [Sphingomonadales bacterium]|nr:MerR family transcriptional regulator [Sphingomonadales bacterium]